MKNTRGKSILAKQRRAGWIFLTPATAMIALFAFWPMIQAFFTAFTVGTGVKTAVANPIFLNFQNMLKDKLFIRSMGHTFLYLLIEVPVMLVLAIVLAQVLNNPHLRFQGFFRTCIFLPCATSLVSYALIFKSLFAQNGLINEVILRLGLIQQPINFLGQTNTARMVIILALIWRWTGYNMVFYLSGLQNIDYSVYEAARIDGANSWSIFWKITVPLLMPTIVMTVILSINGTLQLFDESVNLTSGGPALSTITMSHYIYNNAFGQGVGKFGYASAMSFFIFVLVAILSAISMKAGDSRD